MRMRKHFRITRLAAIWRDEGGQAMVEYSTISFFMMVGGAAGAFAYVLPQLVNAMNAYLNSVYYILNMPLP